MQTDLAQGGVLARILSFALPLAVGMASHAAFNLIDLYIVGRLGEDAVAAVHLGSTINFFPMIFGNGISVGCMALLAGLLASGHHDRARRIANLSFFMMLATALVLGIACYLLADACVGFQWGAGASREMGTDYLEIVSLGTFTMYLLMHVTGGLRAMGNALWPVLLLVGSNVLNIVLDVVLVFGVEGLVPAYGVSGAAWATVLSRGLGGLIGLAILARKRSPLPPGIELPASVREAAWHVVVLGVPQSVQMFVRASLVLTMTRIAGRLGGSAAQAALGVATRLDTFILFAAVGWASGATAMVGQCRAKGLRDRCHAIAWTTSGFAGAVALAVGLAFALLARSLCLAFVPNASPELLAHGVLYLAVMAFAHPAASASLVLSGALNGAGCSVKPMLLDLLVFGLLLQPALWIWEGMGAAGGLGACWTQILAGNWILLLAYAALMRRPAWLRLEAAKLSGIDERA